VTAFVIGAVVFLVVLCALLVGAAVAITKGWDLLASVLGCAAVALVVGGIAYLIRLGEVAR
jgi:uncharacterized membrane protein YbjE (DUF340 family)